MRVDSDYFDKLEESIPKTSNNFAKINPGSVILSSESSNDIKNGSSAQKYLSMGKQLVFCFLHKQVR